MQTESDHYSIYVAKNGDDRWSGTLPEPDVNNTDGPFATLERARDEIRRLKQNGSLDGKTAIVHIRGGIYTLKKTFELTSEDGGTEDMPIIYRAYKNEEVRLIGGGEIKDFKPVDDPDILNRIDESCRDKILQADLKAQGITDFGELKPRGFGRAMYPSALELFFRDRRMQLARYPNGGWATIADVPEGAEVGKFSYEGDRPERWTSAEDVWLHGYWTWDWADSYVKVASIDKQKKEIITEEPHGVYGYKAGQRYYALNILEELDEPGEWYLDRKTGILYFYPPEPIGEDTAFVSLIDTLFSMRNVSYVTLRGLTLEFCRGTAVVLEGGTHNAVAGCVLRNIGNNAVNIIGGAHNGVIGCDIYHTGDGGISISGGDRKTLTPGNNFAENNHIHHYSQWCRTYRPAISVSGVDNLVSHNLIHDAPHSAIMLSGNDNLIEFNEIHHVALETGDVGAFYMGRDWTMRGNIIRYNFFYHIHGPYTHGAMAVYLDDAASGATIFGNVFYKASRAAFIGGGRDNTVENNIFVECEPSVHIDARGLGWAKDYISPGGEWHMYEKLSAVNYEQSPYSERYPQLANILEDDPAVPKGNVVIRNVSYGGRWMDLAGVDASLVIIKDNFTEGDPNFVDADNMNFQLRDDSIAYKLGFQRIPIEKIGLYKDEFRTSLPAHK